MAEHRTITARSVPPRSWRRAAGLLLTVALSLGIAAGPVGAYHTFGTLSCGADGEYDVDVASIEPFLRSPHFDTPAPWSGAILLEGTTRVFYAFTIDTTTWDISTEAADRNPRAVVHCTLNADGPNFPWELTGLLTR
jgi:hypothetical protein